jgi:hypothetical protein
MAPAGSSQPNITSLPTETLQKKAAEQRAQLHRSAADLREKIHETKERLTPINQIREHMAVASVLAAVVAGFVGFGMAGMFTRN